MATGQDGVCWLTFAPGSDDGISSRLTHNMDNVHWAVDLLAKHESPKGGLPLHLLWTTPFVTLWTSDSQLNHSF